MMGGTGRDEKVRWTEQMETTWELRGGGVRRKKERNEAEGSFSRLGGLTLGRLQRRLRFK